jgi:hypothetical protein
MEIKQYKDDYKSQWDTLVRESKNGTFLHYRDFIEYHGDRFEDDSLLFFEKGKLLSVIPGHIRDDKFYSHAGLTYGGFILPVSIHSTQVLKMFSLLINHLKEQNIKQLVYKAIPHIYHKQPAEEDLYALFCNDAKLETRNISSTILLSDKIPYNTLRKRMINKAIKNGLQIDESSDFGTFWGILQNNLKEKYNTTPVHTLQEISYLSQKFQEEIKLYTVKDPNKKIVAGSVVFLTPTVVHIQYIAANEDGMEAGAIDLLVDYIINKYPDKKYFDYGISTENGGTYLNENLISQKEGFGARATVYDIYSIDLQH